jgi:hypothetical protein
MLDDAQMPAEQLEDLRFLPEIMVPAQHSGDPFACPCCANVFSEVLRLADIDLSVHAAQMPRADFPRMAEPSVDRERANHDHGCSRAPS